MRIYDHVYNILRDGFTKLYKLLIKIFRNELNAEQVYIILEWKYNMK